MGYILGEKRGNLKKRIALNKIICITADMKLKRDKQIQVKKITADIKFKDADGKTLKVKATKTEMKPKKKMGRPRIPLITPDLAEDGMGKIPPRPIDIEEVYYWMDIGATEVEIAGSYRVSIDTLKRRLKETTGLTFAELKEKVCGGAKVNLRSCQYKMAEKNASMSIWLGKNWLGQTDDKGRDQALETFASLLKAADEGKLKGLLEQS